jgi:UDP-GlcNAc:undecaprenyl-phosphate/decaprenyl-phosphate GlcNAc-1-phosphate transferase
MVRPMTAVIFLLAMVLSLLCGRAAVSVARRLHFLDHPGERKLQQLPVPLLGGVAIIAALMPTLSLFMWFDRGQTTGELAWLAPAGILLRWLIAGFWVLCVGLVDDRRGLSPRFRLLAQLLALALFYPEISNWIPLPWIAIPVATIWVVGLINSLNFLDNMDAASAGTGFWTALALTIPFGWQGELLLAGAMLILAGSLAGFLWWNRPPARLYMGDAGSTFLGFSLGLFSLLAVSRCGVNPWLAPLFLAVPIYDTVTVFWIRWREGRPIYVGDRRHVTHRMVARGVGAGKTILILNCWTVAAAAVALVLHRLDQWELPALMVCLVLAAGVFVWERHVESDDRQV